MPAGTAKDKAGNKSQKVTKSYKVIKSVIGVDTTKPVITGSRAPLANSFGWNNTDVTVSFICADTGSIQSGIAINTVAGKTLTTEGKDQSVTNTGVYIDVAGNTADPVTVSNINIDKTPPVVMVTLPGTGEYVLNQSITASWSATDALSGVVSPASGTVSIDTSSVGTKTFTLPAGTAKDKAGNSSLIVTKTYTVIEDTEEPVIEDTEESGTVYPEKWSGLGLAGIWSGNTSDLDTILANGFIDLRSCPDYQRNLAPSKAFVREMVSKGARVVWGLTCGSLNKITAASWNNFRLAILDAAQWAQDNGVFEFQIGNEIELWNDDTTLTDAQVRTNLKSLATEVKAIFTNGNISYSCSCTLADINGWISLGKGDIDILAANMYMEYSHGDPITWKDRIDSLVAAFGTSGTYLSEFGPSVTGLNDFSTDEAVQAAAVTEMIDYIKASGMERALYYMWKDDGDAYFGVVKNNGTYRLLWNQALLNSDSVKFATVPTKTTTALLPGAIALIPK